MNEIKQYFVKNAYPGNTQITTYINGKLESSDIVNDYNVEGYTLALIAKGYVYGYPENEITARKERVKRLEEELESAKQDYEVALRNPLRTSDND